MEEESKPKPDQLPAASGSGAAPCCGPSDSEMLDWLSRQTITKRRPLDIWCINDCDFGSTDLRTAIGAAMEAEKKGVCSFCGGKGYRPGPFGREYCEKCNESPSADALNEMAEVGWRRSNL